MKVITSEEGFWDPCPCARAIIRYVDELPELEGATTEFTKAIIRPGHITAMFICFGLPDSPLGLWVSAAIDASRWLDLAPHPLPGQTESRPPE